MGLVDAPFAALALLFAGPWYVSIGALLTLLLGFGLSAYRDGEELWWLLVPILLVTLLTSGSAGLTWPFYHPGETFTFAVEYMLFGVVYAVFRWVHLSIRDARKIKNISELLSKLYQQDVLDRPSHYSGKTFEWWLVENNHMNTINKSKMRIARWIVWWPFSLVGFFLSDLIVDFVIMVSNFAYKLFGNSFRRLQRWIYSQYGITSDVLDFTASNSTDLSEFERKIRD